MFQTNLFSDVSFQRIPTIYVRIAVRGFFYCLLLVFRRVSLRNVFSDLIIKRVVVAKQLVRKVHDFRPEHKFLLFSHSKMRPSENLGQFCPIFANANPKLEITSAIILSGVVLVQDLAHIY